LDAIEQAVRNAFAKGDPEDPVFRERVYRSAQNALEKAIQANPNLAPEAAARRRQHLLDVVAGVESEFVRATEPMDAPVAVDPPVAAAPTVSAPHVQVDPPHAPAGGVSVEPPRTERREPDFDAAQPQWPSGPTPAAPEAGPLAGSPPATESRAEPVVKRRRGLPWGTIAGLLIFLIVIGLTFWTAVELGFVNLSGKRPAPEPAVTAPAGSEHEPQPAGQAATLEDWMPVFSPDNPTTAVAAGGARAEVAGDNGRQVLRISSGASGTPIRFEIGQGVLEKLAGKRAVFDIVARGGEGKETQMSVTCALAGLSDCGRNRYAVGAERAEFLFEVDVPAGAAQGGGAIEIVSDVSGAGQAVELFEIRVTPAEATAPAN